MLPLLAMSSMTPPNCGTVGTGDCCTANASPFCEDIDCCKAVCAQDPFCCNTQWDGICANIAASLEVCDCGSPPPPPPTPCELAGYSPECCDKVCGLDPFCCEVLWDDICEGLAKANETCTPPPPQTPCEIEGYSPECCDKVCGLDPFCCEVLWDDICEGLAKANETCNPPPPPTPCELAGYSPECCEKICALDPFCCLFGWDSLCQSAAQANETCTPPPPPLKGSLVLTAEDCQDDAFPDIDGQQIIVQLSMQDLGTDVTGFQAFILFDPDVLNYNATLTSYTDSPFSLHITQPANALTGPGTLQFDGSVDFNGAGTSADAKLVTIVFDVKDKCATTVIGFGGSNFNSELSFEGLPILTNLTDSDEIFLDDNAPWFIEVPSDIKVPADLFVDGKFDPCVGAVVEFEALAADDCSNVTIAYSHSSGSLFPIGATTVTITATDKCGNQVEHSFVIEVNATNKVAASVLLWGSESAERCILFVTDQCDINANVSVTFGAVGNGAKGLAVFEIACGDYQFLCAKDEQHTLWDTMLLVANPDTQCWETLDQLVLRPGDTDNDGDVDINDVTWLIATWGAPHAPGGCPWDGTRDADFSNNGTVFTEDYSLLSAQWLEKTECLCVGGEGPQGLDGPRSILVGPLSPTARLADLDGNGVVDWRDVRIFEQRHGLPETLSRRMRTNN